MGTDTDHAVLKKESYGCSASKSGTLRRCRDEDGIVNTLRRLYSWLGLENNEPIPYQSTRNIIIIRFCLYLSIMDSCRYR